MHIASEPFLIIVSSPSGAGKTTLCKRIIAENDAISLSISTTTRQKRSNEIEGKDYHFVSDSEFDQLKNDNQFLENAIVFGNKYGTSKKSVEDIIYSQKSVLFDIDWQGARQIKENFSPNKVLSIFILPPSLLELEKRLKSRAQDSDEVVQDRMEKAIAEISHYNEYDYVIVNDDLEKSYQDIVAIIRAKKTSLLKKEDLDQLLAQFKICS